MLVVRMHLLPVKSDSLIHVLQCFGIELGGKLQVACYGGAYLGRKQADDILAKNGSFVWQFITAGE